MSRSRGTGIAALPAVRAQAFSNTVLDKGLDSAPVRVGKHAVAVLRVVGRIPRHELPLALPAVRAHIVALVRAREARARVLARAKALAAGVRSGRPLPPPWRWTVTGFVSERNPGTVPPILQIAAFRAPVSRAHHPAVEVVPLPAQGVAVLEVLARRLPSFHNLPPAKQATYEASVLRREQALELSLFVDELRARAHVRINSTLLRTSGPGT